MSEYVFTKIDRTKDGTTSHVEHQNVRVVFVDMMLLFLPPSMILDPRKQKGKTEFAFLNLFNQEKRQRRIPGK